jgi:hypothetical protein
MNVDGDEKAELLIGAGGINGPGAAYVASASDNKFLFRVDEPTSLWNGLFPMHVFSAGDLDGDGLDEWAVASSSEEATPGQINGYLAVYSGRPLNATPSQIQSSNGFRVDFELNAGLPRAGNTYILLAGFTGTTPGIPVKSQLLPLNFDLLTEISIVFANVPPFHGTLGTFDSFGKATAWFDGSLLPLQAVGAKLSFGYYSMGPGGVYVSTNPVEIPVVAVPGS